MGPPNVHFAVCTFFCLTKLKTQSLERLVVRRDSDSLTQRPRCLPYAFTFTLPRTRHSTGGAMQMKPIRQADMEAQDSGLSAEGEQRAPPGPATAGAVGDRIWFGTSLSRATLVTGSCCALLTLQNSSYTLLRRYRKQRIVVLFAKHQHLDVWCHILRRVCVPIHVRINVPFLALPVCMLCI